MDPYLNHFTQPDSIVPLTSQGTQAWDCYAFVNNNPVRYNDPTGHFIPGRCNPMRNPNCDVQQSSSKSTSTTTSTICPHELFQEFGGDYTGCGVTSFGNADQNDLLEIQKYISNLQAEIQKWIVKFAALTFLNPAAAAVAAYLGYESAELSRLSDFLSRADTVRSTSPGGDVSLGVFNASITKETTDGTKYIAYETYGLYYEGTLDNGQTKMETFEGHTPIVNQVLLALHGRTCYNNCGGYGGVYNDWLY